MHPLRSAITHRHSLSIALMLALQAGHLFAQATYPTPVLTSLSPLGGKPGSTVDFSFKGADIDGAKSILLSSAQAGASYEIPIVQLPEKKGALSAKLPADVKSDLYDIRLVGRYGVSNPRVFQVSPLAVVDSPGTNTKGDTALKVPLDSAIHGVFKAGAPHWFSFEAKKGHRPWRRGLIPAPPWSVPCMTLPDVNWLACVAVCWTCAFLRMAVSS